MSEKYNDIIHLPHHVSVRRGHMSMHDRAAQFAPFAALTGHGAAISETARLTTEMVELSEDERARLDMKQQILLDALGTEPEIRVTYFLHDEMKAGGKYVTVAGRLKDIDSVGRVMVLTGGQRIDFDCIFNIESRLFAGIF